METQKFLLVVLVFLTRSINAQLSDYCNPNPCGTGTCMLLDTSYTCDCGLDTILVSTSTGLTCTSRTSYFLPYISGLIPPPANAPAQSGLNTFFRHLSVGYISSNSSNSPRWNFTRSWNWANTSSFQFVSPVRDQRSCKSCSLFSVSSALESAITITNPIQTLIPPVLTVQQFLDCGVQSCKGGWIGDAYEYLKRMNILTDALYPYSGVENPPSCNAMKLMLGTYGISMYERVRFPGTLGLVLAVQQQPLTVGVEASSDAFLNYRGGIFSNSSCYSNGVDHSMLLVGYNLDSVPPYWILKNSWGTKWGENGYMRIAITDGDGMCGINIMPAQYPVPKASGLLSDPCNTLSLGMSSNSVIGRMNPCGGGTCQKVGLLGNGYRCTCKAPFVTGINIDGTQTCVPSSPCSFSPQNPCRQGICIDSKAVPGTYTCVCPLGFKLGKLAGDSSPTCVFGTSTQGVASYTVPTGFQVSCLTVSSAYGVTKQKFSSMNPYVNCARDISAGTVLNVTSDLGNCTVPYVVQEGETCDSISRSFLPFLFIPINGSGSANPDLDCSNLAAGQMICLVRGPPPPDTICTLPYNVMVNDTCDSIIRDKFYGNKLLFYTLNPGINCKFLSTLTQSISSPSYQVCLRIGLSGTIMASCSGKKYTVKSGDTCYRVISLYYGGSSARFKSLNGYSCADSTLDVGDVICY